MSPGSWRRFGGDLNQKICMEGAYPHGLVTIGSPSSSLHHRRSPFFSSWGGLLVCHMLGPIRLVSLSNRPKWVQIAMRSSEPPLGSSGGAGPAGSAAARRPDALPAGRHRPERSGGRSVRSKSCRLVRRKSCRLVRQSLSPSRAR